MVARFCFLVAAVLFFLEAVGVVTKPMVLWGWFAVAIGLAIGGWSPSWPWKKTAGA